MKVSVVIGTRPEAIKLAPVIRELSAQRSVQCRICSTGQHREMLDQVLGAFDIAPDVELSLMMPNQSLGRLTARAVEALDDYLRGERPDRVLIQGDTTTVFCAALAAFYNGIPVGHVEAGLRTGNLGSPWPEEANRVLATRLADLHFAPTAASRENLLREAVPADRIFVTGNTVVDALLLARERIRSERPTIASLPPALQPGAAGPRVVLITGHRRENFGDGLANICAAIAALAADFPDVHFVYPVHLNPNVRSAVDRCLMDRAAAGGARSRLANVHLIDPLPYLPFVALMDRAHLILTDSGGIQEEAPSLGKPVLVMRDTTERPEAVAAGTVKLVGAREAAIRDEARRLLSDAARYASMQRAHNPYGDGHAAKRIVRILTSRAA